MAKLYKVILDGEKRRLIEAHTKNGAVKHAIGDSVTCEPATHKEVAEMISSGVVLETAEGVKGDGE